MSNLKYRLLVIVALILASAYALFPRTVKDRQKNKEGVFFDTTIRKVPLKLGLDLRGGMYASLEVDESKGTVANKGEALDRALKVVRTRIDEFGVAEPIVQKAGNDRIIVELPGIDDPERAEGILEKSAFLQFQITDKTQALDKNLPRLDAIVRDKKLIAAAGGPAKPTEQVPGIANLFNQGDSSKKAKSDSTKKDTTAVAAGGGLSALLSPGRLPGEFLVAREDIPTVQTILASPDIQAALPPGKVLRWGSDSLQAGLRWLRPLYLLDARPIITGEVLTDAKPNTVPMEGTVVEFTLSNEGGRRFKGETAKHIGDYMAIVLDDKVMSAPVIQGAIGTHGQITMAGADLQAAQDLALVLRAGALPVPLKIADIRTIGASLGQDSIRHGEIAGMIAMGLVVLIMIGYYRMSGVLAVGGLMLYCLYTLAVLAGFDATLTLPGLAGFVLSVGIAVDANVLIFERIREELDRGKTVRTAIDEGFTHAMSAIVDSNVSTVLTASVLYQYGSGPVKGFAVTLIAGIAASMVTSIFVVKTFYLLWLNRTRGAQALSI
jgi:preprotein translocase subunit SecD